MHGSDHSSPLTPARSQSAALAIVVASLGYCVDVYDLLLFNVVRQRSLIDIGVAVEDVQAVGIRLLNMQLIGLLLGGVIWGVLGDRRGRLSVLFGSIVLYSSANLANAYVQDVEVYGWLRFIAGLGLAGELGAGVTLVAELMGQRGRGWGVTIIGAVGVFGAVLAGLIGEAAPGLGALGLSAEQGWRTAYFLGGVLGLMLLALRIGLRESAMFHSLSSGSLSRGLGPLLRSPRRLWRFAAIVITGSPIWFTVGVLVGLAPQLGAAMGLTGPEVPRPGVCISMYYAGALLGDIAAGALSQWLRSRRMAILCFLLASATTVGMLLASGGWGLRWFYGTTAVMGFFNAFWILLMMTTSEEFGTNIRATATTMVPNMIRATAVPITMAFGPLSEIFGHVLAAATLAVLVFSAAILALGTLPETYGRSLDFTEE